MLGTIRFRWGAAHLTCAGGAALRPAGSQCGSVVEVRWIISVLVLRLHIAAVVICMGIAPPSPHPVPRNMALRAQLSYAAQPSAAAPHHCRTIIGATRGRRCVALATQASGAAAGAAANRAGALPPYHPCQPTPRAMEATHLC